MHSKIAFKRAMRHKYENMRKFSRVLKISTFLKINFYTKLAMAKLKRDNNDLIFSTRQRESDEQGLNTWSV